MDNGFVQEKEKSSILVIIFIFLQLVFVIAMIGIASGLFVDNKIDEDDMEKQPKISVVGLGEEVSELGNGKIGRIERSLISLTKRSYPSLSLSLDAKIQPDSLYVKNFAKQDKNYLSAIVDIPEMNLSYYLYYLYDVNPSEAPDDSLLIYCMDTFDYCVDYYDKRDLRVLVDYLLYNKGFDNFSVRMENDYNEIVIRPFKADPSDDEKNSYVELVKDTIKQYGVAPDTFDYRVTTYDDLDYKMRN